MLNIWAVIITFNAESRLRQALSSVSFAREIVIVDCGSTDRTLEICRESGARIIERQWSGYSEQKNSGIGEARGTWILSMDADEELSPLLAREIKALEEPAPYSGYRIPRLNYYFGRALYHGGQYPDLQLRLFRKDLGCFDSRLIHEAVRIPGPVGRLKGDLLHYTYETIQDYFNKFNRYTMLEAQSLAESGKRPSTASLAWALLARPWLKFIRRYFFKLGFLDGVPGLLAALFTAFTMTVSYARYWEKTR